MMTQQWHFCPVTGRGVTLRQCRREGDRYLSPYSDVPVQATGWVFIVFGVCMFSPLSIILTPAAPVIALWGGICCGILAVLRFTRQGAAYLRYRRSSQVQ